MKTQTPHEQIACLLIPNFSIEVCLRDNPQPADSPLALADSELDSAEIIAINQPAADAGLLLNVTVAQGHILCPDLTVKLRNSEREIEQSNGIYKKLQSLSPFVEEAQPGLYFLDASGFELLYKNDRQFVAKIITAVKAYGEVPYPCQVGLARNKFVAQIAANLSEINRFTIVPYDDERKFLHPLPLEQLQTDALRLSSETIDFLHDLGLKTIGQAAAFPANEMIRRFGPQGATLSRLARGDDTAFFTPESATELLTKTIWLDDPLDNTETIIQQVEQMLIPLLAELGRYSHGCTTFDIICHPDNRRQKNTTLSITVERPTLSVKMFLRQLRTTLEKQKLTAPLNGLTVTIPVAAALLSEQLPLADKLETASTPIADLPNSPAITTPIKRDLYLPEQRFVFSDPTSPVKTKTDDHQSAWSPYCLYAGGPISGLRLRQVAREIEVTIDVTKPIAINQTRVAGRGPWELSGQWWSRGYDRHYWEVRTAERQHYLIYHDRPTDRWFLQGVFD